MSDGDSSKMVSICQIETFSIVHLVKVIGYSMAKEFYDISIEAGKFDLAEHTWAVRYKPSKSEHKNYPHDKSWVKCIAFSLELVTVPAVPMVVSCELSLLDQDGKPSPAATKSLGASFTEKRSADFSKFMEITELESSGLLKNDSLVIQCSLQVRKPSRREETNKNYVVVPPSNLKEHLGWLLESREGADVTFQLKENTFVAHKYVLAARSPVFRAQFFGSMLESKTDSVKIEDMKAEVFKAMLYFIYIDALPPQEEVSFEMAQHLLVAADRYGLERLKLICADLLRTGIDVKTAATTLVLAVQHSCLPLKDFCVDFVASREMLDAVMASDGFEHLITSYPLVLKEILEKVHSTRKV
ncbi:BTB/POZ and MATH domain-containing protein 1-like [Carex rostrata]